MPAKTRLRTEHNIPRTMRLHKDGDLALSSLAKRFKGAYVKKQLVTFALIYFDKVAKQKRMKASDSIEETFQI